MKKVEFSEYVNGHIYNSHNGKIVFDNGLINKLNVCKDLTYKLYEIKLDFEYRNTLNKTHGNIGLFKVNYIVHVNYPHLLYSHNEMVDAVMDMFKYIGISYEHNLKTDSVMTASTTYGEYINRINMDSMNYGSHTFKYITIPYMMYSENNMTFGHEMSYM